jgi:glutamine synthetase
MQGADDMTDSSSARYALANRLAVLLDKDPRDFVRADFLKLIAEKGLERITFHYLAADGKLKELKIPVATAAQAESVLAEGERVDGSSLFKGMIDVGQSDLYVVPSFRTAFLNPFDDRSLDFVCRYITRDGEPAPFAPDNILAKAESRFRESTGLELQALGEIEFFLFGDRSPSLYPAQRQQGYHGSGPFLKCGPVLNEMVRHITQISGAVKYAHGEVGFIDSLPSDWEEINDKRGEQMEIEFLPRPIAEMADDVVLGRWLIRNVAYRHGLTATFTPKLDEGLAGNGLHFHLQLVKDGQNIMTNADGTLSDPARRVVGGLCRYAESLTAFGNTVASSYLRLVPNQEAPTYICWSDLNRSALIRVPLGWTRERHLSRLVNPQDLAPLTVKEGRQTVELRSPDGSALVHLLLAGICMSADWAFSPAADREAEGPLPLAQRLYVKGNIASDPELRKRLPALPGSCVASARILREQRGLYERDGVFPARTIEGVAALLESENDAGLARDLFEMPADERPRAARRAMHKDLHKH